MRLISGVVLVSGLVFGATLAMAQDAYVVPIDTPANVKRAVESDARSDRHRARDSGRKPAELLTLAGIEEGDSVIEFAAVGHYYTFMLLDAVGADGHVEMVEMPWITALPIERGAAIAAEYDNATYKEVHYNEVDLSNEVDVVTMVLFYHDLLRESAEETVDTADMNARVFAALKPGGTYLIVDHKAEDGSGWRDAMTIHRIDTQTIIDEVTAVGFELTVESDLLANPADDRTGRVLDPTMRGQTDRAVLVFRKPI